MSSFLFEEKTNNSSQESEGETSSSTQESEGETSSSSQESEEETSSSSQESEEETSNSSQGSVDSEGDRSRYNDFAVLVSCVFHGSGYKIPYDTNTNTYNSTFLSDAFPKIESDNISIIRNTLPYHLYMSNEDIHQTVDELMFHLKDFDTKGMNRNVGDLFKFNEDIKSGEPSSYGTLIQNNTHQKFQDIRKVFNYVSQKSPQGSPFFNEILSTELENNRQYINEEFWIKVKVFGKDADEDKWEEIGIYTKEKDKELDKSELRKSNTIIDEQGQTKDIKIKDFVEKFHENIKIKANEIGLNDLKEYATEDSIEMFKQMYDNLEYKYVFHTCSPPYNVKKQSARHPSRYFIKKRKAKRTHDNMSGTSINEECEMKWSDIFLSMLLDVGRITVYHRSLNEMKSDYSNKELPELEYDFQLKEGNLNIMDPEDRQQMYIKTTEYMKFIFYIQHIFKENDDKNNSFLMHYLNELYKIFPELSGCEPIHLFKYLLYQLTHLPYDNENVRGVMTSAIKNNNRDNIKNRKEFPFFENIYKKTNNIGSMVVSINEFGYGLFSKERNERNKKTLPVIRDFFLGILDLDIKKDIKKTNYEDQLRLIEYIKNSSNSNEEALCKLVIQEKVRTICQNEDGNNNNSCIISGGRKKRKTKKKRKNRKKRKTKRRKKNKNKRKTKKKRKNRKKRKTGKRN